MIIGDVACQVASGQVAFITIVRPGDRRMQQPFPEDSANPHPMV